MRARMHAHSDSSRRDFLHKGASGNGDCNNLDLTSPGRVPLFTRAATLPTRRDDVDREMHACYVISDDGRRLSLHLSGIAGPTANGKNKRNAVEKEFAQRAKSFASPPLRSFSSVGVAGRRGESRRAPPSADRHARAPCVKRSLPIAPFATRCTLDCILEDKLGINVLLISYWRSFEKKSNFLGKYSKECSYIYCSLFWIAYESSFRLHLLHVWCRLVLPKRPFPL